VTRAAIDRERARVRNGRAREFEREDATLKKQRARIEPINSRFTFCQTAVRVESRDISEKTGF